MNKIFFVSHDQFMIENFRKKLVESFLDNFKVELIIPTYTHFIKKATIHNLSISNFFNIYKIILLIKKNKDQSYFFTFGHKSNIFFGLISLFCKVSFVPNITGQGRLYSQNIFLKKLYLTFIPLVLFKAKAVFVQNQRDEIIFKKILPHSKIIRLPGSGVSLPQFKFNSRRTYSLNSFLYSSRLINAKGLPELVRIIDNDEFFKENKILLNIYGKLNYKDGDTIKKHVINNFLKNKNLKFHGFAEEKDIIYSVSDFIIFPSEYNEGTPRTLLECMAKGLICISLNRFYVDGLITDGVTGFLINKIEDLPKRIQEIQRIPFKNLKKIALNARKHMESNYSEEIIIKNYHNIIL